MDPLTKKYAIIGSIAGAGILVLAAAQAIVDVRQIMTASLPSTTDSFGRIPGSQPTLPPVEGHEGERSKLHSADRSQGGHDPVISGKHETEKSLAHADVFSLFHSTYTSANHLPSLSEGHAEGLSKGGHAPLISVEHDPTASASHLPDRTRAGDNPTGGHFDFLSKEHMPEQSLSHVPELTNVGHHPVRSVSHSTEGSASHSTALSATGHQPYRSVEINLEQSHDNTDSKEILENHKAALSEVGHYETFSSTHFDSESARHSLLRSWSGHDLDSSSTIDVLQMTSPSPFALPSDLTP